MLSPEYTQSQWARKAQIILLLKGFVQASNPSPAPKRKGGMQEKATVIKKIVDRYLVKILHYDLDDHLFFDENVKGMNGKVKGYTDIEIRLDSRNTDVIIEAKRSGKPLGKGEKEQVIDYGKSKNVTCVFLTNGSEYLAFNSNTGNPLTLNGKPLDDIPRAVDLPAFLQVLKKDSDDVVLTGSSIPSYRINKILQPPLTDIFKGEATKSMADLEHIFKHCHDIIRDSEHKTPAESFEEFSKILFLKLYSEKLHGGTFKSTKLKPKDITSFEEIAQEANPATVKKLIVANFSVFIKAYDEVFDESDKFKIKKPETFRELVTVLAPVNFDSEFDTDVKGRAYEHFLSTVLRGSKLGQFFTPRAIVKMMVRLANPKPGDTILDPACGSGGFLIKAMQAVSWHIDENTHERSEDKEGKHKHLREDCLYGSDAGVVAKTAKMNMILAGDGHTHIVHENSLTEEEDFLRLDQEPLFNIILTNPPFGLNEKIRKGQLEKYDVPISKAQSLFLQLMIRKVKPNGLICSVVDEGVLNTPTYKSLRKYIFRKCFVLAVFSLPVTTFKPHYSGVKASVILLRRKENELLKQDFPIFGYDLQNVGYDNTGRTTKEDDIPAALDSWSAHVKKYVGG